MISVTIEQNGHSVGRLEIRPKNVNWREDNPAQFEARFNDFFNDAFVNIYFNFWKDRPDLLKHDNIKIVAEAILRLFPSVVAQASRPRDTYVVLKPDANFGCGRCDYSTDSIDDMLKHLDKHIQAGRETAAETIKDGDLEDNITHCYKVLTRRGIEGVEKANLEMEDCLAKLKKEMGDLKLSVWLVDKRLINLENKRLKELDRKTKELDKREKELEIREAKCHDK